MKHAEKPIRYLLLLLLIAVSYPVHSQRNRNEVKLDTTISFEDLLKRKTERTVSWINPDGSTEIMPFIEMAIPMNEEAKQLTCEFNQRNYGINSSWLTPKILILHAMDLGSLRQSLELSSFLNDHLPESWSTLYKAGKLSNGSHFIIDRDGTVYCLSPPWSADEKSVDYTFRDHKWYIKRHQDGNPFAIGIENVTPANGDFTDLSVKQVQANAQLVRWLIQFENSKIQYVTSHHQFNDEVVLNKMHQQFGIIYKNKLYRTIGRNDIGDEKLFEIIQLVQAHGYRVSSSF